MLGACNGYLEEIPQNKQKLSTTDDYDQLLNNAYLTQAVLPYIDVLVDGRFDPTKRKKGLLFRGSSNQRLINVPASLRSGKVILWEYNPYPQYV